MKAKFSPFYIDNIKEETENNVNYRKVLATTPNMQLVVMSLQPQEEIGEEIHPYTTQFIRIEKGHGLAVINNVNYELVDDVALVIPLNTKHNIINLSKKMPLKLYTIYSPPNHAWNRLDVDKDED
jgi:mannose-6-phosphate isomerase-like protein (cupin superfamily)